MITIIDKFEYKFLDHIVNIDFDYPNNRYIIRLETSWKVGHHKMIIPKDKFDDIIQRYQIADAKKFKIKMSIILSELGFKVYRQGQR